MAPSNCANFYQVFSEWIWPLSSDGHGVLVTQECVVAAAGDLFIIAVRVTDAPRDDAISEESIYYHRRSRWLC